MQLIWELSRFELQKGPFILLKCHFLKDSRLIWVLSTFQLHKKPSIWLKCHFFRMIFTRVLLANSFWKCCKYPNKCACFAPHKFTTYYHLSIPLCSALRCTSSNQTMVQCMLMILNKCVLVNAGPQALEKYFMCVKKCKLIKTNSVSLKSGILAK